MVMDAVQEPRFMRSAQRDEIESRLVALIPRLHRFAWTLTGAKTDADDITQEALERALQIQPSLATDVNLEAWLLRVARNIWYDQLRRRRVRAAGIDPVLIDNVHCPTPPSSSDHRIEAHEALSAILALGPGQREVAILVLVEGHTYQEAATILLAPVGTVMSRLSRARQSLALMLLGPEQDRSDPTVDGD